MDDAAAGPDAPDAPRSAPGGPVRSLADVLMLHPLRNGEGLLFTVDREVSAEEARDMARDTARRLAEAGVAPGQAVGVRLPDGPEAVTTMVGIWLAGAVFVPVNERAPAAEQDKMLAATGSAALVDPDGLHRLGGDRRYPETTAFILWTSGTTGPPKPIVHTHESYLGLIDRVLNSLRRPNAQGGGAGTPRTPTPNLIPTPLALNSGIYNALFGLRAGAPLVIMGRFDPHDFAGLVSRFAIRSTVLPPAAMVALNDADDVTDLTPLRYVRSITAPLSPLQGKRFADKFGVLVLNGYGQAEIGEVIGWTAQDAQDHPEKIGAVGRPHPGVDVKLVGDDTAPVRAGDIGRLLVRPRQMAAGYAEGDELSDRLDPEGYLDTGDLARMDDDGFIWIEGRGSDVINRGGNKVFPDQVEEVLKLSPTVADVAVVGVPDERLGEVPVALVVPAATAHGPAAGDLDTAAGDLDTAALDALAREHLLPYKVPVRYLSVGSLSRNEVGKLLRRELAARYALGEAPATGRPPPHKEDPC